MTGGRGIYIHNNMMANVYILWSACVEINSPVTLCYSHPSLCPENWDRIPVRAVRGLISRAGMVSICPLL